MICHLEIIMYRRYGMARCQGWQRAANGQDVRYDAVPWMAMSGECTRCMDHMVAPKKTLRGYLYESHGLVPIEIWMEWGFVIRHGTRWIILKLLRSGVRSKHFCDDSFGIFTLHIPNTCQKREVCRSVITFCECSKPTYSNKLILFP